MPVNERDPHTGHAMTGHEWNGIKELNTPVPKVIWISLGLAALFALIYWVLMPAWPLGKTYTKGLLHIDQHARVEREVEEAERSRADWASQIVTLDFKDIQGDRALMKAVREMGPALFGDNCAACHGVDARGGHGFPNLTDDAWLWGGTPEKVFDTIRVGVNSRHPDTRVSQMLAFGHDGLLDGSALSSVVDFVQSLSDPTSRAQPKGQDISAGKKIFAQNCAVCHGADGRGNTEIGAPNLTDGFWLYGGDQRSIYTTVWGGRQAQMPSWEGRLTLLQRKVLTLYILDLSAPRKDGQR